MKPDWKDAPRWAKWLAQDCNGQWCWYEFAPATGMGYWLPFGRFKRIVIDEWDKTLEPRP